MFQAQIQELAVHVKAVFRLAQLVLNWMFQAQIQGASSLCDSNVQGSIFLPSSRASKSRQGSVQTGSVSSQVDVSGLNTGASSLCQSSLQTGSTASTSSLLLIST